MSQENVEIVRGFFESIGHAGETPLGLMRRLAHEDVVYVEDPKWPGGDTYRGQEAVAECWSSYDEVMGEAVTASVTDVRDAGGQIVAIVRVSGRTRESGIPLTTSGATPAGWRTGGCPTSALTSTPARPSKPPG